MIPTDLIKPTKAARILGVHPATIWRWILTGKLRALKTPTSRYMISEADLRAVMVEVQASPAAVLSSPPGQPGQLGPRTRETLRLIGSKIG